MRLLLLFLVKKNINNHGHRLSLSSYGHCITFYSSSASLIMMMSLFAIWHLPWTSICLHCFPSLFYYLKPNVIDGHEEVETTLHGLKGKWQWDDVNHWFTKKQLSDAAWLCSGQLKKKKIWANPFNSSTFDCVKSISFMLLVNSISREEQIVHMLLRLQHRI